MPPSFDGIRKLPLIADTDAPKLAVVFRRREAGGRSRRKRRRQGAAAQLSVLAQGEGRRTIGDIFSPRLIGTTALITFAYSAHITSFYFIIKWVPKIVVDMGFAPSAAAGVLTWANVGGATGGATFGVIAGRVGLKRLTLLTLAASTGLIIWFGRGAQDLPGLAVMVAVVELSTNSAVVGLYALFAQIFPTHVRATGTGFAIGVGDRLRIARLLFERVALSGTAVTITVRMAAIDAGAVSAANFTLTAPIARIRMYKESRLIVLSPASRAAATPDRDERLVQLLAEAFAARGLLLASPALSIKDIAERNNLCRKRFAQLIRISWLAPDIIRAALDGRQPASLDATRPIKAELPATWAAQRGMLLPSA